MIGSGKKREVSVCVCVCVSVCLSVCVSVCPEPFGETTRPIKNAKSISKTFVRLLRDIRLAEIESFVCVIKCLAFLHLVVSLTKCIVIVPWGKQEVSVCLSGCLSGCLSVCLSGCLSRAVWQNYWGDFNETFQK